VDNDQPINRPAMRPVQSAPVPPGRKVLMPRWWLGDLEPGTTLLAREQH
jgi:hypothetical protein